MALQTSGKISVEDINTEINPAQPTVIRDLESAGILFGLFIDPNNWSDGDIGLGMDEFYGASTDGIIVTPNSFTFPNTSSFKDFSVISGTYPITITSNRAFFVVSNETTSSFRVTAGDNSAVGSPARSGSVTVSSAATSSVVSLTQLAGTPPEIDIDPNIREVGGLTTTAQFIVFTNAPSYIVSSTPSFVTGTNIDGTNLFVTLSLNNETGAQTREENIVVQTNTGFQTEAEDSALIRQFATAIESIVVSGPSGIANTGQLNVDYDVETVDEYGTIWTAGVVPLNPGDDISWITNIRQFYDSGTSGDGTIRVDFSSNPVGSPSKFAQITAINPSVPVTNATVQLASNPATLSLDPTDNVDININGGGSFVVTTNAQWSISYTNSSFLPAGTFSPSSGNAGVTTVTVSANPRPVGFDNPRQQDITVQTATGLIDVVIDDYTLIQPENPATISITPTSRTISGYVQSTVFFSVSSNTTWQLIAWPSFVPFGNITVTSNSITAIVPAQPYGANPERSDDFVVETTTAANDKQATATLIQQATEDESIVVTGPSSIGNTGQQNVDYDVETIDGYGTVWTAGVIPLNPGDDVSWATIDSQFYDSGTSGDGTIRVDFSSNPIGSPSKFAQITATKAGVSTSNQIVQLQSNPATLEVSPTSLSFGVTGTPTQNVSLTSNTLWAFSSVDFWINLSQSNGSGNATIGISADPRPAGTTTTRSDTITVTTNAPGGTNISRNITISQAARPATISITPTTVNPVGSNPAPVTFGVSTNAPDYSISAPAYVSISGKTISGFTATWDDNDTGSSRSGTITVTTITGGTDVNATCSFTQAAAPPPPSISIVGTTTAPTAGSTGNVYNITSNGSWSVTDAALSGFNPIDITFTTSTSGTNNGSVTVTFGAYNGDGSETLRSQIIASLNGVSDDVTVTQSPPPATTTTTTTTLAPQSFLSERNDGGATGRIGIAQGYSEGSEVLVNDGSGICWTLGTLSTLAPQFSIISVCPPPTTTTTTTTTTAAPTTCNSYVVTNEGNTGTTVEYLDCTTGEYTTALIGSNRTRTFCARTGTLQYVSGSTLFTITDLGSC